VLVDNTNLQLDNTLITITGETGAGKSILLNALALTLGARASQLAIRADQEIAEVVAEFDISHNEQAKTMLKALDLTGDDSNSCYLRRIVKRNQNSKAWINGTPCLLEQMKQVAQLLIHIYGQHDSQLLLSSESQLQMLDQFANHQQQAAIVKQIIQSYRTKKQLLFELQQTMRNPEEQLEYLQFQLDEFEELGLEEGEFESLSVKQSQVHNRVELGKNLSELNQLVNGEGQSMTEMQQQALKLIAQCKSLQNFEQLQQLFEQSHILIEEASSEIKQQLNDFENSTEQIQQIEERLSKIYNIARKHQVEPDQLFVLAENWRQSIDSFSNRLQQMQQLQQEVTQLKNDFIDKATALHQSRLQYASKFCESVNSYIQQLHMAETTLTVDVALNSFDNANLFGLSTVTFKVHNQNVSQAYPLSKVASGGELSRISLAVALTNCQNYEKITMVFDEIDSGVGGQTAFSIGALLAQLGQMQQVLCVTHLAQVASQSSQHFRVIKNVNDNGREVEIIALDAEQKVAEIARMTSGEMYSTEALDLARQMINRNR